MNGCVHLQYLAKDPRIPIHFDTDSQCYSLELSKDLSIKPMNCIICGGHKRFNAKSKFSPCECGRPGRWSRDPSIPIQYDPAINAYHLLTQQGRRLHLGFCPYCGGQLHRIPIKDIASEPSRADMEQIMEKVRPAHTIKQLIEILGPPDEKHGPLKIDPIDKELYRAEDIQQMLEYKHLSPTAILQVTESENGALRFSFTGQQLKESALIKRIRTFYYRVKHYLGRFNFVLWEYTDNTTNEKLLCHHKICRWIVLPCAFSSVGMVSTIAQCLIFRSKLDFILMIIFTAISLLLIVPSIFCFAWMDEIEQVLIKRGMPIPSGQPIEKRIQMWALKMMLWCAGLVILGSIIRKV